MAGLLQFFAPLGLEGQWHGAAAVALVTVGMLIFVGTVYILLVTIYGWLQAYLVTMIALMSFSIILAGVWLIGIPGTIPGTGPRGTEPYWQVFLPDSEQGQEYASHISSFPKTSKPANGWRFADATEEFPGGINGEGELDNIKATLLPALAGYFQRQKTGSSKPADYDFFFANRMPKTPEEIKLPQARVFFKSNGNVVKLDPATQAVTARFDTPNPPSNLLFGIEYPAVAGKHPAIKVFAYRNKGQVFMSALQWMLISILLFALHLWWLARFETKQKTRETQLASGGLREPAKV